MEFKHLEIKLNDLTTKFRDDLILELSQKGHKASGKLANSIVFSFKKNNNNYDIELECLSYIKYLDNGDFIKNFMKLKKEELSKELPKAIKKDILNEFKIK